LFNGLFQPTHLIVVLLIALVVLGPRCLPEAGRALGQGLREFTSSITGAGDDDVQVALAAAARDEDGPRRAAEASAGSSEPSS
jgi:sec-independent protein translocase protein TatA